MQMSRRMRAALAGVVAAVAIAGAAVDQPWEARAGAPYVDNRVPAQGKGGEIYPNSVGKLVMPGTKVYFRMHYHAVGEEVTDTMEMGWWFYPKEKTPKYSAEYLTIGGGLGIEIPPNTVTEHQGATVLKVPTILHNFQPHMHYRGKAQTLEAIYPDGRREIINGLRHVDTRLDPPRADHVPAVLD